MADKISLIVLSNSGTRVQRFSVSRWLLTALAVAAIGGGVLCGLILYDYHGLRQALAGKAEMSRTLADQHDDILQHRLQIQSFAHEINTLKDKLVKLNQFEEKIRVIANLGPVNNDDQLFGVGGPAPEDLDPQLEPTQRHEGLMRDMHHHFKQLDTAAVHQVNRFGMLLEQLEGQRNLLASTPAIRPTGGWTTSRFGNRTSPFTGRQEFHKGLDIANRKGTAVLATAEGVVTFVGTKGPLGNVVVIDHGHGMITRYAHLSQSLKKRGEAVKRGDIIGQMGSSGRTTGPHLHYEVHLNGVPVNPETYILN